MMSCIFIVGVLPCFLVGDIKSISSKAGPCRPNHELYKYNMHDERCHDCYDHRSLVTCTCFLSARYCLCSFILRYSGNHGAYHCQMGVLLVYNALITYAKWVCCWYTVHSLHMLNGCVYGIRCTHDICQMGVLLVYNALITYTKWVCCWYTMHSLHMLNGCAAGIQCTHYICQNWYAAGIQCTHYICQMGVLLVYNALITYAKWVCCWYTMHSLHM